ncbi:MAG: molybdopterin converting factor subunit 1 [Pontibacterium sp.]
MLTLVYFASFREALGVDREQFEPPADVHTVSDLIEVLVESRGEPWRKVLLAGNVLVAVNQEMVQSGHQIAAGDEVAFFPPVTGG